MKGYDAWFKFQSQAWIHIARWSEKRIEHELLSLNKCFGQWTKENNENINDPITLALKLSQAQYPPFVQLANDIGEKQVWALLIYVADAEKSSIGSISDAMDEIRRLQQQEQEQITRVVLRQNEVMRPDFKFGQNTRIRQSERAKHPRNKAGDDGDKSVTDIINSLAFDHKCEGLTAKELWGHFISRLEEIHAGPEEEGLICKYMTPTGIEKRITIKTFQNRISMTRKNKSR